jgi:hypothetical protein
VSNHDRDRFDLHVGIVGHARPSAQPRSLFQVRSPFTAST